MHLGRNNRSLEYNMGIHILEETTNEKDLGVHVDNELKFHLHSSNAIKKANRILGTIKNSCSSRDKTMITLLYKSMVCPHLEYGNAIWGPFYKKDIVGVERVQRRATKLVNGLYNKSYQERLQILKLPSLVYRRRRGDMILVYKIVNSVYRMEINKFYSRSHNRTRGHQFKFEKKKATIHQRINAFSVRTVNDWNSLPEDVVEAPSVNSFKSRLDKHWENRENEIP